MPGEPLACNVAGQGAPGHVAWLKLMTFGREHVLTLESQTGPGAGWIYAVVGIHLDHAANSSLTGERAGRQEPSQKPQPLPDRADEPDQAKYITFRIMYIVQGITSLRHSLHVVG